MYVLPSVTLDLWYLCVCRCISKVTGEHQDDWDDYLDPILFGIRTSIQECTKYTPFFLMHGREARFPLEAEESSVISVVAELGDVQYTIEHLSEIRGKVFANASKNIEASQKKQKEQYTK